MCLRACVTKEAGRGARLFGEGYILALFTNRLVSIFPAGTLAEQAGHRGVTCDGHASSAFSARDLPNLIRDLGTHTRARKGNYPSGVCREQRAASMTIALHARCSRIAITLQVVDG